MYTVYIIESITNKKRYVGVTSDIDNRLRHHNSGANRSTKNKGPWKVIHTETYESKETAWLRERKIKSYKGGVAFKKLIGEV
jgi:putative endonuclease